MSIFNGLILSTSTYKITIMYSKQYFYVKSYGLTWVVILTESHVSQIYFLTIIILIIILNTASIMELPNLRKNCDNFFVLLLS